MEIEKTRETSWRIQLKNKNESIEITSVEISGEVRIIKLALLNDENTLRVEMNKEEFFNFLSLISAFKDVVIGDETGLIDEEPALHSPESQKIERIPEASDDVYPINLEPSDKPYEENEKDELNPEEWDPW
ncbi:MAG: hypothetical protein ACFE8B_11220 [Candidatus Hermodarchaeota archaeon]